MKMIKRTRLGAALAAAAAVGAVLVAPAPASAVESWCTISGGATSCTTATLYPHADHWMKMRTNVPTAGTLNCAMIDSGNGVTVASASVSSWRPSWAYEQFTVPGLYSTYYVHCTNSSRTGTGRIFNN